MATARTNFNKTEPNNLCVGALEVGHAFRVKRYLLPNGRALSLRVSYSMYDTRSFGRKRTHCGPRRLSDREGKFHDRPCTLVTTRCRLQNNGKDVSDQMASTCLAFSREVRAIAHTLFVAHGCSEQVDGACRGTGDCRGNPRHPGESTITSTSTAT